MFATTLTTERLKLRPLVIGDAEAVYARWASDPVATRYVSWRTNQTVEETRELIASIKKPGDASPYDQHLVWAISTGDDPLPIGSIGAKHRGTRVEIGYIFGRAAWGQGFATEAAKALIEEIWREPSVWRVEAHCHVEHVASARVLEKCGLRREGVHCRYAVMAQFGEEPQDCVSFAQVRDDL